MKIQAIRGINDIQAPEVFLWQHIENTARRLFEAAGYQEVRPPLLESTALFKRGVGETTDIVEKEMYTFEDKGGDSVTLRPEGTAGVVRALVEHGVLQQNPLTKLYYIGSMFRYERPQKGRYRQFHQIGMEVFGVEGPRADVEVIALHHHFFHQLGVTAFELHISSIGCETCRPPYREKLLSVLSGHRSELCADCQRRIDKNPMRVLDCKNEKCRTIAAELPLMVDHLCQTCASHFDGVQKGLRELTIPFVVDPKIVRGLDYYCRTAFEFISNNIGAQGTICGGGRYDGLVSDLGGPKSPAVGCALGIERIVLLLQERMSDFVKKTEVFFVTPDIDGRAICEPLCYQLRLKGIAAETDLQDKAMKHQMKRADKIGAQYCVIIGQTEVQQKIALIKDMKENKQESVPLENLEQELLKRLRP